MVQGVVAVKLKLQRDSRADAHTAAPGSTTFRHTATLGAIAGEIKAAALAAMSH